jgi:hypothetical protein
MRGPIDRIKDIYSMQNEEKSRSRVYVVEQQPFDYSPAQVFGDPIFMEVQKLAPDAPGAGTGWNSRILQQIRRELSSYVAGIDFLIPTGAPAKLMVVGAVLKEHGPNHNILGWDAKTQRYLHYILVL